VIRRPYRQVFERDIVKAIPEVDDAVVATSSGPGQLSMRECSSAALAEQGLTRRSVLTDCFLQQCGCGTSPSAHFLAVGSAQLRSFRRAYFASCPSRENAALSGGFLIIQQ